MLIIEHCRRTSVRHVGGRHWPFLPMHVYRVVQKTDTQIYFWDNFGNSAPILTILSLLQAEIYGA